MAMVNKTRAMLEGLVKDGSFKWLIKQKSAYDEEIEEMGRSPSAGKNWLIELSPVANVVVRRCSKYVSLTLSSLVVSRKLTLPSMYYTCNFADHIALCIYSTF